jgi:hypothetical protein
MKGVNYQQEAFEKKFYWLNHTRALEDGTGTIKYASDLTQLTWEGWCAAMELSYKQRPRKTRKK